MGESVKLANSQFVRLLIFLKRPHSTFFLLIGRAKRSHYTTNDSLWMRKIVVAPI